MDLTTEERDILAGKQGEVLRKALESVVRFGQTFGATRLAPLDHPIHVVTSFGVPLLGPLFSLMDELIQEGLRTPKPFTTNPRPMDFENVPGSCLERLIFKRFMYRKQEAYEEQLGKVGLRDPDAFSCACYMDEVGNVPERGTLLAWAESSAVAYANSVIGALSNRNSGVMELLCGITGRVPVFGLLTPEGRMADWHVEIRTTDTPPQLLGRAIGMKVGAGVPFITGLDDLLGTDLTEAKDFLKDMGAAAAASGAVGLYHVENLTPEASDQGRDLLESSCQTYVIDDDELARVEQACTVMWRNPDARPAMCFIGCPHLSLDQLHSWLERVERELSAQGRRRIRVRTVLTAAPQVARRFREQAAGRLERTGMRLSSICPLMYMANPLCARKPVITNSSKLGTYSTARTVRDERIPHIVVRGRIDGS